MRLSAIVPWLMAASSLLTGPAHASARDKTFGAFLEKLEKIILKHYTNAKTERTETSLRFEHRTRDFLIHLPLKTGEWQEARKHRGPDRGGILGSADLRKGKWQGAAMVPQQFDRYYFVASLAAPYSERTDQHLEVHLYHPKDAAPDLLSEFAAAVREFSVY